MFVSRYGRVRVLSAKGKESYSQVMKRDDFVEDNFCMVRPTKKILDFAQDLMVRFPERFKNSEPTKTTEE